MLDQLQSVFASFQKNQVKYLVIGGIAAVLYGVPRATFNLDLLVEATPQNAKRLLEAMIEARFGTASLTTAEELLSNEITIFKDRVRLDVQTSTPGITFGEAWPRRVTMTYAGPVAGGRFTCRSDCRQAGRRARCRFRRRENSAIE